MSSGVCPSHKVGEIVAMVLSVQAAANFQKIEDDSSMLRPGSVRKCICHTMMVFAPRLELARKAIHVRLPERSVRAQKKMKRNHGMSSSSSSPKCQVSKSSCSHVMLPAELLPKILSGTHMAFSPCLADTYPKPDLSKYMFPALVKIQRSNQACFLLPICPFWIDFQNTQAIVQCLVWDFGLEKYTLKDHVSVLLASFKTNPRNFMCLVPALWIGRSINSSPADLRLLDNSNPSPRDQNFNRTNSCLLLLQAIAMSVSSRNTIKQYGCCLFSKHLLATAMSVSS
jgi:hypothetical protein